MSDSSGRPERRTTGTGPAMIPSDELRLVEWLCARLCHDLSGPVGAAAAGAELLAEQDGDPETLDLVSSSAAAAAQRLAFLRAAFGFGSQPYRPGAAKTLIERYFSSLTQGTLSPLVLDWRLDGHDLNADQARTLFNGVMVARDALPRGGSIIVQSGPDSTFELLATGQGAKLTAEAHAVLIDGTDARCPRSAQAVLLRMLAGRVGCTVQVEQVEQGLRLWSERQTGG